MNWLKRFLGLYDKKQVEKAQEVSDYVHDKKNQFTATMVQAHREAKKEHQKASKTEQKSIKIESRVNDVTRQIYLALPNR